MQKPLLLQKISNLLVEQGNLKLLPGTVLEKNICGKHFKEVCYPYLKCLQSLITSHTLVNEIDGVLGNKLILLVVFKDVLVFMKHCLHEGYT